MSLVLSFALWFYVVALSIHIVEESVMCGGFVKMVQEKIWSDYSWKKFFWYNTFFYLALVFGMIFFECNGGIWIIIPLSIAWMCVTNGIWHLIATIVTREFSPGLISSPIYWILMYFIFRYSLLQNQIDYSYFNISVIIGALLTVLPLGVLFIVGHISKKRKQ